MGNKIFVSYKYADDQVEQMQSSSFLNPTIVRDYVDIFETKVRYYSDDIFKGESDGDDLSSLDNNAIWEKLKDRIYDSSVTVVFLSPGMKEFGRRERDQWIPWEISYSLKEVKRRNRNGDPVASRTNAMIAVVLPDRNGSYSYLINNRRCCISGCQLINTDWMFVMLRENMFNRVNGYDRKCLNGLEIWNGGHSLYRSCQVG